MIPAALIDAAGRPYRAAGRFAWHFALGKLRHDPFFAHILANGLIPDGARILDLGSGQGLLAAWLLGAHAWHRDNAAAWPAHWSAPPAVRSIHGIEMTPRDVERARIALRAYRAQVSLICDDIRRVPFPQADVVVACDVLHYIDADAQEAVLRRVRESLAPDGVLLLRVSDAAAGWRAGLDRAVDFGMQVARSGRTNALTCRSEPAWLALLDALHFQVTLVPMGHGAHDANRLLIARPSA
ncbi:class I SAM-dependent methyltransferase [Caballeronia insecticola]|uniref:Putative S-adenosyl-L-methionine-dependent methyltransferase n=1 Tax=Caballeronia insecticola TaxID=758793 RepID=R4WSX6_9BURK|nr:class I SAM-dependent methyltransferase [Caballeronia insecticola]BAN27679.1 putative S-adenosyl-L-methionine-dependent methyltransferase [Caballeronia insecticola]